MGMQTALDRSLVFTLLLEYMPGYGRLPSGAGSQSEQITTECVAAWHASDSTNMVEFVREWIAERQQVSS